MNGRFKKIEGLNYKRGAIEYPQKLAPSDRYHLYTKPFYNLANKISRWNGDGLDEDTQRHFCDFANIAYLLALPAGARILDVGCGSGWMSEYFARLGYRLIGIDLSPELIAIAQERLTKLGFGVDQDSPVNCSFLVHDIEQAPLAQTFDAIICYDSLHHFEDEQAVLRNIATMLRDGGLFFIAEGEKPPEGSASEAELQDVMQRFETLEAPFSREYLCEVITQHGFVIAGDYTAVTGFVDRDNLEGNSVKFIEPSSFNYLLCKRTFGGIPYDSSQPGRLLARLSPVNGWQEVAKPEAQFEFELRIENVGDTLWLVSREPLRGRVRVGLRLTDKSGKQLNEIHGWPRLQHPIAPGESTTLQVSIKTPNEPGHYSLKIDLVDQNVSWFEEHGSEPLVINFAVVE